MGPRVGQWLGLLCWSVSFITTNSQVVSPTVTRLADSAYLTGISELSSTDDLLNIVDGEAGQSGSQHSFAYVDFMDLLEQRARGNFAPQVGFFRTF